MKKENSSLAIISNELNFASIIGESGELSQGLTAFKNEGFLSLETPFEYRGNMKDGYGSFTCNGVDIGSKMEITVLNWRIIENIRPSDEYAEATDFMECIILGSENVVGLFVLNKTNFRDLLNTLNFYRVKGIPACCFKIVCETEKVKGAKGTFFVIRYKVEEHTKEYLENLQAFLIANKEVVFAFKGMPNIDEVK